MNLLEQVRNYTEKYRSSDPGFTRDTAELLEAAHIAQSILDSHRPWHGILSVFRGKLLEGLKVGRSPRAVLEDIGNTLDRRFPKEDDLRIIRKRARTWTIL